jgi:threonyl-tRNA synthetase
VGENEKKENKVNVRTREGVVLGTKAIEELISEFKQSASDYC